MASCPVCGLNVSPGVKTCPQDGAQIGELFSPGDKLGDKYEFLSVIASGGMGIIYKAKQITLGKIIAIKMLHPHLMTPDAYLRFQREARAASNLQHSNLVGVYDFGTTDGGQPYMVMDYVDGCSLSYLIKDRGRIETGEALEIFLQIAGGLAHAHQKGVLHRDLKPSNVMLAREEGKTFTAKVLDFGIAKIVDDQEGPGQAVTRTGDVFGSPLYMSPEQGTGSKLDARSDYYSLGCLMFEALTGTPPFVGKSVLETVLMHVNDETPGLKEASLGIDYPEELERIIARLLKKNPDERYQSLMDLIEDLSALKKRLSSGAAEAASVSRSELRELAGKNQLKAGDSVSDHSKSIHINPLVAISTCLALFCVLGLVFVAITLLPKKALQDEPLVAKRTPSLGTDIAGGDMHQLFKERALNQRYTQVFEMRQCGVNDLDVKELADCKNLRYLDLESNELAGFTLGYLVGLPYLETLKLNDNPIEAGALLEIAKLKHLKTLQLGHTKITPESLKFLAPLTELQSLVISNNKLSGDCLKHLAPLNNLRFLDLRNNHKITDEGVKYLRDLSELKEIDLTHTGVKGPGLPSLGELSHLKSLRFVQMRLKEPVFTNLAKLKNVKKVDLSFSTFKPEFLRHLYEMPKLEELNLSSCKYVSPATIEELKKNMPRCHVLSNLAE